MSERDLLARVLARAKADEPEMLAALEHLVNCDSGTGFKRGVDEAGRYVAQLLRDAGASITVVGQPERGDQVVARWGWGSRQVLFLGHLDTVWPPGEAKRRPFTVKDRIAFGPGVLDMKAGLVQMVWALRFLAEMDLGGEVRLAMLLNSDEELQSRTSASLVRDLARESALALVFEPAPGPLGGLITARKASGYFRISVVGRSAHAGEDIREGVNAITELMDQVREVMAIVSTVPGATVNVGTFRGGRRHNVVPDYAEAELSIRVASPNGCEVIQRELARLRPGLLGAQVEVSGGFHRPPLSPGARARRAFTLAQQLGTFMGYQVRELTVGSASDGNLASAAGCPTLDGLGGVGAGAHAPEEHVYLDHMAPRVALAVGLTYLAGKGAIDE